SPFAVSAILLCELLPAMTLGALLGAAADRWSRKAILVAADVLRCGAFIALALVGSFEATVVFALLAGVGQAAFQPAVMASLPGLVSRERLSAATGVYGAIQELGYTAGPVLAAATFVVVDAPGLLLANGITFALSALLIATIRFGPTPAAEEDEDGRRPSLFASVADGARALRANRAAWTVVLSSTAFVCFLGAVNVAELVLVRETLDGGPAHYALVVAAMGLGLTAGSLLGAGAKDGPAGARQYLLGLLLCGIAFGACAVVPTWPVALATFALLGLGNGLALVAENVLLQHVVPDAIKGRVFGLKGSLISTSFAVAYFGGGALVALVGPRTTFAVLAAGCLAVWSVARTVLAPTAQPVGSAACVAPQSP
ncbi:MAG TPA: MFS transporter, partial [Solirubrobacteraceae bacterium]|nr:MFS transporter [Solirubrobacteraceae bacterium]